MDVVRRPIEFLRSLLQRIQLERTEKRKEIEVYIPRILEDIGEATGLVSASTEVISGIREERMPWKRVVAYLKALDLQTPTGTGAGKVEIDSFGQSVVYYLLPFQEVKAHHVASAHIDHLGRISLSGHEKLSALLSNLLISSYTSTKEKSYPYRIEIVPVSFRREGERIIVHRELTKGRKGMLVSISLPTTLTREELEIHTQGLVEKLIKELRRMRSRKEL